MLNLSLLFLVTVFALLRWRRRRANTEPTRYFKPDSWAEFRPVAGDLPQVVDWGTFATRVWDRTRSSVCDNHNVTKLDGGWYVFDDLAHKVGESDLSLADALAHEPADTNPGSGYGVWTPVMEPAPEPDTRDRFQPGDWVLYSGQAYRIDSIVQGAGRVVTEYFSAPAERCTLLRKAGEFKVGDVCDVDTDLPTTTREQVDRIDSSGTVWFDKGSVRSMPDYAATTKVVKPVELTSPWVGRSVHVGDGVGAKCVWAGDDLVLANGETVPAASAELHWDDVREGDTAYWIHRGKSYSVIRARWKDEHRAEVVDDGYTHVPLYSMCRFTPANVTA